MPDSEESETRSQAKNQAGESLSGISAIRQTTRLSDDSYSESNAGYMGGDALMVGLMFGLPSHAAGKAAGDNYWSA